MENPGESMLEVLKQRRTYKVIGDASRPNTQRQAAPEVIDAIIAAAGNAPVHYACDRVHLNTLPSPVPWRCYKLDIAATNALSKHLIETGDTTKVPDMLAAASYLLQVTWLPDADTIISAKPEKDAPSFIGTLRNMEHIAAASAFIQSVLLAADQLGMKTYWSSGGPLRAPEAFAYLRMPEIELLLGSVFLFPAKQPDRQVKAGNLASKKGNPEDWSVWLDLK